MSSKFPFQILNANSDRLSFLNKQYVQVGPKKYFLPENYKMYCDTFYNLEPRSDDVWLFGIPRSGTTLAQEIIWLIANDLDFERAKKTVINNRFPYLEYVMIFGKNIECCTNNKAYNDESYILEDCIPYLNKTTKRRFIKSHLPLSFFSQNLWTSKCKIIYCMRDPRDVIVSRYYLFKSIYKENFNIDFKIYWNLYKNNEIPFLPHFEHVKEGWNKRNEQNVLLLRYEETSKKKRESIMKIAKFLNKELSEDQIDQLEQHTHIDKFKENKSINFEYLKEMNDNFIRKGKVGGWKEKFTGDLENEVNEWFI